jgi:hypothetical protein
VGDTIKRERNIMKKLLLLLLLALPVQGSEILFDNLAEPITGLVYTGKDQWIYQAFNSGNSTELWDYRLNIYKPAGFTGSLYLSFFDPVAQKPVDWWMTEMRLEYTPSDQISLIGFSNIPFFHLDIPMVPNSTYYLGMSADNPIAWAKNATGLSLQITGNTVPEPQTWAMGILAALAMTAMIIAKVKK